MDGRATIGNVALGKLVRISSLLSFCWAPFLCWQPVTHIFFAAPAVTSVRRCSGRFFEVDFQYGFHKGAVHIHATRGRRVLSKGCGRVHTAQGFPGCFWSVDCVHIGWDRYPGCTICCYVLRQGRAHLGCIRGSLHLSEIHSGLVGRSSLDAKHKHISCTDHSVADLLMPKLWPSSKTWQCVHHKVAGFTRTFFCTLSV